VRKKVEKGKESGRKEHCASVPQVLCFHKCRVDLLL